MQSCQAHTSCLEAFSNPQKARSWLNSPYSLPLNMPVLRRQGYVIHSLGANSHWNICSSKSSRRIHSQVLTCVDIHSQVLTCDDIHSQVLTCVDKVYTTLLGCFTHTYASQQCDIRSPLQSLSVTCKKETASPSASNRKRLNS